MLVCCSTVGAIVCLLAHFDAAPLQPLDERPANQGLIVRGIDPNTASVAELGALPGIGPAKAQAIVDFREEYVAAINESDEDAEERAIDIHKLAGGENLDSIDGRVAFREPEDLEAVRGIGPKTVERFRPWLRFDDDRP